MCLGSPRHPETFNRAPFQQVRNGMIPIPNVSLPNGSASASRVTVIQCHVNRVRRWPLLGQPQPLCPPAAVSWLAIYSCPRYPEGTLGAAGPSGLRDTLDWGTLWTGGPSGLRDPQGWGTLRAAGHSGLGDPQGCGTLWTGGPSGLRDTLDWGTLRAAGHSGLGDPQGCGTLWAAGPSGLRDTLDLGTLRAAGPSGLGDPQGCGTLRAAGPSGLGDTRLGDPQGCGTLWTGGHSGLGDPQGCGTLWTADPSPTPTLFCPICPPRITRGYNRLAMWLQLCFCVPGASNWVLQELRQSPCLAFILQACPASSREKPLRYDLYGNHALSPLSVSQAGVQARSGLTAASTPWLKPPTPASQVAGITGPL
ncbi:uncharacterized protein LOC129034645 [Pongo pygmaeus]|uniref:uncharacterized protein LOC129034645 n=1 Tax=Pongo pygmaeus TaxID=9600 RepID=UPI0023E1C664|nr:uncharacterized protein LOC129034645 [Pongo pygmaeus]